MISVSSPLLLVNGPNLVTCSPQTASLRLCAIIIQMDSCNEIVQESHRYALYFTRIKANMAARIFARVDSCILTKLQIPFQFFVFSVQPWTGWIVSGLTRKVLDYPLDKAFVCRPLSLVLDICLAAGDGNNKAPLAKQKGWSCHDNWITRDDNHRNPIRFIP